MKKLNLIWIIALLLLIPLAYAKMNFPYTVCNGAYCRIDNITFGKATAGGNFSLNYAGTDGAGNFYNPGGASSTGYMIYSLWNNSEVNWSFQAKMAFNGYATNEVGLRFLDGIPGVSIDIFQLRKLASSWVIRDKIGTPDYCNIPIQADAILRDFKIIFWTNSTLELRYNNTYVCSVYSSNWGDLAYFQSTYYDGLVGNVYMDNMTAYNCSGSGSLCNYVNDPLSVPTIALNSQSPPDINSINAVGINTTIGATVTSSLGVSNSYITYKINSTTRDKIIFVNGSAVGGYTNKSYFKAVGSNYSYILDDNEIYPATYNLDDDTTDDNIHTQNQLTTANSYIFTQIINLTTTTPYNFLEIMSNSTGLQRIYGCNSSYRFESDANPDPSTNLNCLVLNTIPANTPYNHSHSNFSQHQFITLPRLNYTNPYYFGIRGNNGIPSGVNYYTLNGSVRTNITRLTINSGIAYTIPNYTLDLHVHQFSGNSSLYYFACANDTTGQSVCTSESKDTYELADIPPTSPSVYAPSKSYYSGSMWINYTASQSPNGYAIQYYNISLYNPDFTFNKSINQNNSVNLSFYYDISAVSYGNYRIGVRAYDSSNQRAEGFSFNFTIDNQKPNMSILYPDLNSHIDGFLYPFRINGTALDNDNIFNITHNSNYFGQNTKTNNSFEFLNITNIPSGNYSITLTAYDMALNSFSLIWNFTVDTTAPSITKNSPLLTTSFNQTGLYVNTSAQDDYELFDYNLTCLDVSGNTAYTHYKNLINYSYYSSNGFFNWESYSALTQSVFNCTTTARDTHTQSSIEDIDTELTDTKAKMKFKKNNVGFEIINPLTYKGTKIKLKKNFDRYIITLETNTQEKQRFSPEPKHIVITSDSSIMIMKDSKYRGHLVMTSGQWLDFEGSNATIQINRLTQNSVEVIDYETSNEIEYKSIGALNTGSVTFFLTKYAISSPLITVTEPSNNTNIIINQTFVSSSQCYDIYGLNYTAYVLDNASAVLQNSTNATFKDSYSRLGFRFNTSGYSTGTYYINYQCINQNLTETQRYSFRIIDSPSSESLDTNVISMSECILLTTAGVFTAFFFFLLAFGIMLFAKLTRHGLIGFFGALILLLASFYIFVCVAYISLVVMAISFLLMWYFINQSWHGNL